MTAFKFDEHEMAFASAIVRTGDRNLMALYLQSDVAERAEAKADARRKRLASSREAWDQTGPAGASYRLTDTALGLNEPLQADMPHRHADGSEHNHAIIGAGMHSHPK